MAQGYVVITYWPEEQTSAIRRVLEEAGLLAAEAQEQIDEVLNGGMIYLTFNSVEKAEQVASAAAQRDALAECGPV